MTFCKKCNKLISTQYVGEIQKLVKCSFMFVNVCNDCATDIDFMKEREGILRSKGSRTLQEWKEIENRIKKERESKNDTKPIL